MTLISVLPTLARCVSEQTQQDQPCYKLVVEAGVTMAFRRPDPSVSPDLLHAKPRVPVGLHKTFAPLFVVLHVLKHVHPATQADGSVSIFEPRFEPRRIGFKKEAK